MYFFYVYHLVFHRATQNQINLEPISVNHNVVDKQDIHNFKTTKKKKLETYINETNATTKYQIAIRNI